MILIWIMKKIMTLSIKDLEIRMKKEDIKKFGKDGSSSAVLGDILGKYLNLKKPKKEIMRYGEI